MPTVNLLGVTRNTDNYGVRVLLTSAVALLARADSDASITIVDYGRTPEQWNEPTPSGSREVRLVNLRFSWRIHLPNNIFRLFCFVALARLLPRGIRQGLWRLNPWLRRILEARASFSLAGGDSFSDIYGFSRFLYVALPQMLVILLGQPLVLLPQTFGPFQGQIARWMARYIVCRAHSVYSRDEQGVNAVRALAGANDLQVQLIRTSALRWLRTANR